MFASDLELRYEAGEFDDRSSTRSSASRPASRPDFEALLLAGSAIFTPNYVDLSGGGRLDAAGYRLGILSNTCPAHWAYCHSGRYALLDRGFEVLRAELRTGRVQAVARRSSGRSRGTGRRGAERDLLRRRHCRPRGRRPSRRLRRRAIHHHAPSWSATCASAGWSSIIECDARACRSLRGRILHAALLHNPMRWRGQIAGKDSLD